MRGLAQLKFHGHVTRKGCCPGTAIAQLHCLVDLLELETPAADLIYQGE
jgi:hypothetical protein